jgi:hypothetical protein
MNNKAMIAYLKISAPSRPGGEKNANSFWQHLSLRRSVFCSWLVKKVNQVSKQTFISHKGTHSLRNPKNGFDENCNHFTNLTFP